MTNDVKVLKLITGEEVIAKVTKGNTGLITLNKPIMLQLIPTVRGVNWSATLIPWLKLTNNEKVTISTEYILIEDDPTEEAKKNYLSLVTGLTL